MASPNTQEQLARIVGISQQDVSLLIRKGTLTRGAPLSQLILEYTKNLRAVAAGHQSSQGHDLIEERARLAARQSEKIEVELAKQRNDLIPLTALNEALRFIAGAIRAKLLALPSRFRSVVSTLTPKQVDTLDSLVREILTELSHERFPPDIRRLAEQYFSDLHTTAQADDKRVVRPKSYSQRREQRGAG